MKAMVYERYGRPDVLELREIDPPAVDEESVLVRVKASSLNAYDWHMLTGTPYFVRLMMGLRGPKNHAFGSDYAGVVEAVGKDFDGGLRPGDEVFGTRNGALAELVSVRNAVARKPANLGFDEAASVSMAAVTALQALRDKGGVTAGQRVLVNGAAGGVGTFAVQLAKAFGARVTGVCSTRNVELVRSLGADEVVDYTQEDFTRSGVRYDLVVDVAGSKKWSQLKRVLADDATVVIVGGQKTNRWIGPLGQGIWRALVAKPGKRRVVRMFANMNRADLDTLRGLIEDGKVKPYVERVYPLAETREALDYLGTGHARGKLVVALGG